MGCGGRSGRQRLGSRRDVSDTLLTSTLTSSQPSPLDALVAAYVHVHRSSLLERPELLDYADRVLDCAQRRI
jgi:hypothetical protein